MSQPMPPPMSPSMPPPGYAPHYSFLPYYQTTPDQLLAPARRAGWMLLIVGVLTLLFSGFCAALLGQATNDILADAITKAAAAGQDVSRVTPDILRTGFKAFLVVAAMCGIVAIILGIVVRSGGRAAAIVALVLLVLPIVLLTLMLLGGLTAGPLNALIALVMIGVPLALLVASGVLLVGAIRAAPFIEQARLQQQMMLHQQQAAYYAHAYGQPSQAPPGDDFSSPPMS